MKDNFHILENKLKIKYKHKALLKKAFTHKSFDLINNNEKLEFLGDRVIGLVLSKKLYEIYPNDSEGVLDKKFANLVNRKTCSSIAWNLGLNKFIILGDTHKKILIKDEKILSDICESLIGSIYIDKGFDFVEKFILKIWDKNIKNSINTVVDSKTKLQEYSLKVYKKLPIYFVEKKSGPQHNPIFKVSVKVTEHKKIPGSGTSIKIAQQNAAQNFFKINKNIKHS